MTKQMRNEILTLTNQIKMKDNELYEYEKELELTFEEKNNLEKN